MHEPGHSSLPTPLLGDSALIDKINEQLRKAASTDVPVLLTGESGTGKGVAARFLHDLSARSARIFQKINCPAIPTHLFESELFGYERGAFTGAKQTQVGQCEQANKGTLFLDEIGELDITLQAKLLHALQEFRITRLGAVDDRMLDIRLICATNCQLEAEVAQGRFRTDLFHRINVVRIHIPPLRERPSDIPLLVDKFVRVYSAQFGRIRKPISPTFLRLLQWYEWPGNVRELENVVKRYVLLGDDEHIVPGTPALIGLSAASPPADTAPLHSKGAIQGFEKKVLLEVLRSHNWNRAKAARSLGINYRVLLHKMKEAGLPGVRSPIVATRKLSGGDSGGMPV